MAGYPASVVIKNLAAFPYNVNIGLVDCLPSQNTSSRECETIYNSIAEDNKIIDSYGQPNMRLNNYLIYVCPRVRASQLGLT